MKLIFVRHGETIENANRITQSHSFGELSKRGKEQVKKLALRLKDEKIDLIFSSDLQRTRDTTREIIKFHPLPVHYDPLLRERCSGIFEGKSKKYFYAARKRSGLSVIEFKPENGESLIEVRERLNRFWIKFFQEYQDETILISSHGRITKILLSIIFQIPLEEALQMGQANACITIVEINKKPQLIMNNNTEHLK